MRPNFLVIGCGKCGTTSLCALLSQHPDVFVCSPKEPNFLAYEEIHSKGWGWYESLFQNAGNVKARGEGSVSYTVQEFEQRVIGRLLRHLPDVRLIYITRDPLSRIESVYREHHNSGHRRGWYLPFNIRDALEYRPAMLTNTLYWERISAYRAHFPDERILILFLEDLKADPAAVLSRSFEFLSVDPAVEIGAANQHLNPGTRKYYDTRLMRWIRTSQIVGRLWRILPGAVSYTLERPLRRRFDRPLEWPSDIREQALDRIGPDARRLLQFCGKPDTFWDVRG